MFPHHLNTDAFLLLCCVYKTMKTWVFLGILLFFLQVKKHIWQPELLFSLCLMLSLPIKIKWGPKAYLVITSHSLG